jgi:peptidoglycan/LPS O-acetylase OafA/YrhL
LALNNHRTSYRPDVDGLRAVAVVSVLAYHVALILPGGAINRMQGGFVGVDIFFVISGYLIIGIIQRQIESGTFLLREFYARRVRRILPAFYLVLICTSLFVLPHIFPQEIREYTRSALASVFSVSNIYFWATTNYFAAPASTKPLLHTWSLGVEEQFYLLIPSLLVLLARGGRGMLRISLVGIGVASFLLSVYGAFAWPDATFYLAPSRVWEFILGGLLALGMIPHPRSNWARNVAGIIGLAFIAGSDLLFTAKLPFPGIAALVPCGGAVLIISAGEAGPSVVGRILSWKPVVFVGLISYSLYLWHWPVLVCQSMFSMIPGGSIGKLVKLKVLLAIFLLSIISFYLVERPFRRLRWHFSRTMVGALAFSIFLLAAGRVSADWYASRFSAPELEAASYLDYLQSHPGLEDCQIMAGQKAASSSLSRCLNMDSSKKNYLILADSEANHLFPGLVKAYPDVHFIRATGSGCPLLLPRERALSHCESLFGYLYENFLPTHKIDGVILEGRWDTDHPQQIIKVVRWFQAHEIPAVVLGIIPQYDQPLPRLMAMSIQQHDPGLAAKHRLDTAGFDEQMETLAQADHFTFIGWTELLCDHGKCPTTTPDGVPLVYDFGHLTIEGSTFVARRLRDSGRLDLNQGMVFVPQQHQPGDPSKPISQLKGAQSSSKPRFESLTGRPLPVAALQSVMLR